MSLTIGIDPRIRARRVAVRRAEGRRRLRALLVALAVVGLVIGAWGLTRSPLLDVDHVRVDGTAAPRAAEVTAVTGLVAGTPLFDVDTAEVADSVRALPWVADVEVRREWPGTVRLVVTERVAVATLGTVAGGRLLLDGDGVVVGTAPPGSTLPAIDIVTDGAPGTTEPAAAPALAVVAALTDDLRPWVEAITIAPDPGADGLPRVGLELVGSATVDLGTTAHLGDKMSALRAVLAGADLSCVRVIDVVVADLTTVRRDPVCDGQVSGAPAGADG